MRWSQWQLEKAAARGNEGDKDLPTSGGSAPIEAAATSPEESAAQGSGGGTEAPTLSMQVETEACEWCMKRVVECVWKDGVACEACHIGKKRCSKAGKPGRKQKNPNAPPASSALTSKRARMTPVPPPSSSAPPKVTLKVCPRVISRAIPAAGAAASLPMPQETPVPSISSSPSDPLFLSSSQPNTPIPPHHISPPPIPENDGLIDNSVVFGPPISGILEDEADPVKPQPNMEEIDLTMPCRLPLPEEDVPRARKGKC
ncbi:hypothetical protein PISMIDRAFT_18128 [Pisolithus microcarpus 441]|uniref:Unplaced genomic scaffold scaffold_325, whole genome shotgun sequence n=1 Tax=Pisolithus microcarpus 441 TaxID=765257 RepID=A0A0C9YZE8_9AGAM|nr:hypothetical protein PISMIDRAFT_18128 [Pisolithus microcarpus 441]